MGALPCNPHSNLILSLLEHLPRIPVVGLRIGGLAAAPRSHLGLCSIFSVFSAPPLLLLGVSHHHDDDDSL